MMSSMTSSSTSGARTVRGALVAELTRLASVPVAVKYGGVCSLVVVGLLMTLMQYQGVQLGMSFADGSASAASMSTSTKVLFPSWDVEETLRRNDELYEAFTSRMPTKAAERAGIHGKRDFGIRRRASSSSSSSSSMHKNATDAAAAAATAISSWSVASDSGVGSSSYIDDGSEGEDLSALQLSFQELVSALQAAKRFDGRGFDFGAVILEPVHSRDFVGTKWKALELWRDLDKNVRDRCARPHDRECQMYFDRKSSPTFLYSAGASRLARYKWDTLGLEWDGDANEAILGDSERAGRLMLPDMRIFNGTSDVGAFVSGGGSVYGELLRTLQGSGGMNPPFWFSSGFRWRMSSHGAHTTLHQDPQSNTFVEVVGVKRFHLYPPEMWADLNMWPEWHRCTRQSLLTLRDRGGQSIRAQLGVKLAMDADDSDAEAVRNSTRVKPYAVVDLRPGELLMLPASWFHRVECISEEPCQSVSIFWETTMAILCMQKLTHFWPGLVNDDARSGCHAREVFNRMVSAPQPAELDSLKSAGAMCPDGMPRGGGKPDDATRDCLKAVAEWHFFILAIVAKHLTRFPPLLALHPELEAGGTDFERARLFVRMLYRSRYAVHTSEILRGMALPFSCEGDEASAFSCPHVDGGLIASIDASKKHAMENEADEIAHEAVFNFNWDDIEAHFDLIPVPDGVHDEEAYRLDRLLTHYGGVMSMQLASLIDTYAMIALFEEVESTCRFLRCVAQTDTALL